MQHLSKSTGEIIQFIKILNRQGRIQAEAHFDDVRDHGQEGTSGGYVIHDGH